jgi:small subunit ribosomal protein S13
MAEEQKKKQDKGKEHKEQQPAKKKPEQEREESEVLVRILGADIPGSKNIYSGMTRIKGVSWAVSNAICLKLGLPRSRKIGELSKDEIKKIEKFIDEFPVYDFLKNRRLDIETGESAHYHGTDLDMKKEFDIKRLKGIKCYRGIRHALKQPVRGQRTRSHFRKKGRAMGVKKKE